MTKNDFFYLFLLQDYIRTNSVWIKKFKKTFVSFISVFSIKNNIQIKKVEKHDQRQLNQAHCHPILKEHTIPYNEFMFLDLINDSKNYWQTRDLWGNMENRQILF